MNGEFCTLPNYFDFGPFFAESQSHIRPRSPGAEAMLRLVLKHAKQVSATAFGPALAPTVPPKDTAGGGG